VLRVRTTLHLAIAAVLAAASVLAAARPASAAASTGFLDRTPGGDGTLLTNVAGGDSADAVATRADGKIVVAGTSSGSPHRRGGLHQGGGHGRRYGRRRPWSSFS